MAEPIIERDLEFHFTHGSPLELTVRDGRDAIQDIDGCPHCGAPQTVRITQRYEDGTERTANVHTDKLNGTVSTRRVVPPEPEQQLQELIEAATA